MTDTPKTPKAKTPKPPRKPLPQWLSTGLLAALWTAVGAGFLLGFGAWSMGMLPNMMMVVLMGAVLVLGASRLIRAFTGGLKLSDWRLPKTRADFGPFVHVVARVIFWLLAAYITSKAIVPIQFTASEAAEINVIIWVCGGFAALMSQLPKASRRRPMTVFALISVIFFTVELSRIHRFEAPKNAVVLAAPFAGDSYVFQGGPSALLSHHYPHKNQTHALDLVILDDDGRALAEGANWQTDPCLGVPLLAPVAGVVVDVQTGVEDDPALKTRKDPITGNRVIIDNGAGAFVMLAHVQKGSMAVAKGDVVTEGQVVGACGNSGNSSGPHLHIQVQTTPTFDDPDIRSLPMAFKNTARFRGSKTQLGGALTYRRNDIMRAVE
ncbi:M23 family metallopeptidase [Fretibacter rubidus]|uniref:M23 family metallopeptidase n=1 Tax=Fretibacter rubidus TaxID=570162 RepID=UPI00352B7B7C